MVDATGRGSSDPRGDFAAAKTFAVNKVARLN